MSSTAIEHMGYDEGACELHVTFVGGGAYTYYHVPKQVYAAFRAASFEGQYLNPYNKGLPFSPPPAPPPPYSFPSAAFGGSSSPASSASAVSKSFASRKLR